MNLEKRHAICFGINYENNAKFRLRGCINDVKNIGRMLFAHAGFRDVRIFCDDVPNPRTTYRNILYEIEELAKRSNEENLEIVWIHFAGHGTQIRDDDNDEKDRMDESIVPSDFEKSGMLRDDDIKLQLRKFNPKTKVICVFDCCHSGTIMDLKFKYVNKRVTREESKECALESKVICISGCKDVQTSADAYNVRGNREFSGAMSSCLLLAITDARKERKLNILNVLNKLHNYLRSRRFIQIPQLTSSFVVAENDILF